LSIDARSSRRLRMRDSIGGSGRPQRGLDFQAQGCAERRYPGSKRRRATTPSGLCRFVFNSQGSRCAPTLGLSHDAFGVERARRQSGRRPNAPNCTHPRLFYATSSAARAMRPSRAGLFQDRSRRAGRVGLRLDQRLGLGEEGLGLAVVGLRFHSHLQQSERRLRLLAPIQPPLGHRGEGKHLQRP